MVRVISTACLSNVRDEWHSTDVDGIAYDEMTECQDERQVYVDLQRLKRERKEGKKPLKFGKRI